MGQVRFFIVVIFASLIFAFTMPRPAFAAVCRTVNGHQICILDIKRSAKKYWEYRVTASIDGITQPNKIYECRDRIKILPNGTVVRFGNEDVAEVVCSVFRRN